jgi:hypothetical protein
MSGTVCRFPSCLSINYHRHSGSSEDSMRTNRFELYDGILTPNCALNVDVHTRWTRTNRHPTHSPVSKVSRADIRRNMRYSLDSAKPTRAAQSGLIHVARHKHLGTCQPARLVPLSLSSLRHLLVARLLRAPLLMLVREAFSAHGCSMA